MYLSQLFQNKVLFTVVGAWFLSCLIKGILVCIKNGKLDRTRFLGSGGMPSSHSATVTCLATCVGIHDGFNSVTFVICCMLAFVVMYDASGVRREAGQQAQILNMIIDTLEESDPIQKQKRLKELLGHKPIEVVVGAVVGLLLAVIVNATIGLK